MSGLYIHIPYCKKKCSYCDFVSFAGRADVDDYAESLIAEMRLNAPLMEGRRFDTVFVGGGTPSVLPDGALGRMLDAAKRFFQIADTAEITVEVNPESVTAAKLREYKSSGVNRLSIGMQSADDAQLALIGRIHTHAVFSTAFALAREAGFENINVDIMHGLPIQSVESYLSSIRFAAQLGAEHISSYSLILEAGTPLFDAVSSGTVALPDADLTADMEDAGFELLDALGYSRYEISNFAKPGRECRHNVNYWKNGDYLGLGVSAHSALHINGRWLRYVNSSSLEDYFKAVSNGRLPVKNIDEIERDEEMFECIMTGLRMTAGIDRREFFSRFGIDPVQHYASAISSAELEGNIIVTDERLYLTKRGLDFQNEVLLDFMQ